MSFLEVRKGWHFWHYISNTQNSIRICDSPQFCRGKKHFHGDHNAFIAKRE
jgi:hypothetical protein